MGALCVCVGACACVCVHLRNACARLFVLYHLVNFTLCVMVHHNTQNKVVVNKSDPLFSRLDFVQPVATDIPVTSPSITSK